LVALLAVVLVVGLVGTALAQPVDTEVTVQAGGGSIPIVKCKWETPDDDPATPGTQVDPPGVFGGTKTVTYWAVVTDEEDNGHVGQVYVDVYHPAGPPENGSFKYEVPMNEVDKFAVGIPEFEAAAAAGLVVYGPGHTYDTVLNQLQKCVAEVWMGSADLDYHQPAGDYLVKAVAIDRNGNDSLPLENTFLYVPTCIIEIDFDKVNYGSVSICQNKWISGDTVFDAPVGLNPSTVRNIGNTNSFIWVEQDDMGLGQDVTGMWNVEFDARLGNDPANQVVYDPFVNTQLPNALPLCNTDELDFSIHVKKGTSGMNYIGTMTVTCTEAPF
jgi:hypothetical protein